jgi:adenylate cyclase
VGAGIHTGIAYVGSLGSSEQISDFTALGDSVNTTARLASVAAPGELLISLETATSAGLDSTGLDRRTIDVRGRVAGLDVFSEHAPPRAPGRQPRS